MAEKDPEFTSSEPSDHECSICSELFTEPKLLPCFHLLCRHCLVGVLESQPKPQCPFCRHPIVKPRQSGPRQSWADVADALPTDLAMAELAEAEHLLKKDHQCCICEVSTATVLCLDCGDTFCVGCVKMHTKQTVAKDHTLRDLNFLTPHQVADVRPSPCQSHPKRQRELYCPSHDASVCTACFVSGHRSCPNVTDVQQRAEECYVTLRQLLDKLRSAERELDLALGQLDQHLVETKKKAAVALDEMRAVCDRLKATIDARYASVQKAVESSVSDFTHRVLAEKACFLQKRCDISSRKRAVQRTVEAKSPGTVISMTSVMTKSVTTLDCCASTSNLPKIKPVASIMIDARIVSLVEQQIAQLADISALNTPHDNGLTSSVSEAVLSFHDQRGQRICLSENKQTAVYYEVQFGDCDDGIVIGRLPIMLRCLYQARIDQADAYPDWMMPVGVVTQDPVTLTLPKDVWGWSSAVVVWSDHVNVNGTADYGMKIGRKLQQVSTGSRVGVLIDDRRSLHLYIDGVDQGVIASDMPDRCYPLFLLNDQFKQITGLPV